MRTERRRRRSSRLRLLRGFDMSRIGRMPITIPSGVEVTIDGSNVTVKGPKGSLSHVVVEPITVARAEDGQLAVTGAEEDAGSGSLAATGCVVLNGRSAHRVILGYLM